MPGGKGNIRPEDGKQFGIGNKSAEKWNEQNALIFGRDLLAWMLEADENIFFDDFIYLHDHTGKYAGEVYADLPKYLCDKFSSFSELYNKCKQIEKIKLKKFSAFDKLNAGIAKFLLSAEYGLSEKTEHKNINTNVPLMNIDPLSDGTNNGTT